MVSGLVEERPLFYMHFMKWLITWGQGSILLLPIILEQPSTTKSTQEKVKNNGRLLSPPSFSTRALPGAKSFIATSLHRMLQKLRHRASYFLLIWNLFSLSSLPSSFTKLLFLPSSQRCYY